MLAEHAGKVINIAEAAFAGYLVDAVVGFTQKPGCHVEAALLHELPRRAGEVLLKKAAEMRI